MDVIAGRLLLIWRCDSRPVKINAIVGGLHYADSTNRIISSPDVMSFRFYIAGLHGLITPPDR